LHDGTQRGPHTHRDLLLGTTQLGAALMAFNYWLRGPQRIVLTPFSEKQYRGGDIASEVEKVAQERADHTGKDVEVFSADECDVLFQVSPK
jgi:hypothetical protein